MIQAGQLLHQEHLYSAVLEIWVNAVAILGIWRESGLLFESKGEKEINAQSCSSHLRH